jgi:hypothetical protein
VLLVSCRRSPVLVYRIFFAYDSLVAVEGDKEDLLMHLAPTGSSTGCSSKSFFLVHTTAHLVGVNTAGDEGYPVLWESSERPDGVAKIVPLSERLSGMRGSVQHRRNLAL